jgi:hypothetical protein
VLLAPSPSLPDHTEIKDVQLPTVIGLVLKNAGKRTVGEIRKPPDANLRRYPLSALRTGPCLLPSEDAGRPNRLVDLRLEGEMTRPLATPKLPRKRPRVRGWMRRDRSLCLRHLSSDTLNQDAGKAGNNDATSLHRMEATRPNLSTRVPNWGVPVSVWQHEQCFYGWTQF